MSVDRETVKKIANLSRIAVTEGEIDALVPELNNILGWVEQLSEVDCSKVEPMTAVIPNKLRLRDDVVETEMSGTRFWPMLRLQNMAFLPCQR